MCDNRDTRVWEGEGFKKVNLGSYLNWDEQNLIYYNKQIVKE